MVNFEAHFINRYDVEGGATYFDLLIENDGGLEPFRVTKKFKTQDVTEQMLEDMAATEIERLVQEALINNDNQMDK